jgi:hypothetical protein
MASAVETKSVGSQLIGRVSQFFTGGAAPKAAN